MTACADPGGGDAEELDEGGGGKGDNASSTSTSEPLEVETLQRIACEAVAMNTVFAADAERRALMDRCTTLAFTVTSKTSSDLYQHAGSRQPVTVAMDIGISDTGADRVARLFRVYNLEEQRFVWRGTIPSPIDDAAFVGELAKGGEAALRSDDPLWSFHVFPADWEDLPVRVDQALEAELAGIAEVDSATRGAQPLRVRREVRDAGWVAPIDLHMTGGEVVPVRLYFSADGARVAVDPPGVID
jgi:truncated hemoglobin YjbI